MSTRIWYHARCADGFGAAYALWKIYGEDAVYEPVEYGEGTPGFVAGDKVWIVDFSYSRHVLQAISQTADLTVIDHHKTAEQELADLPFAHFDMARSGAVATWEFAHETPVPELLLYLQDRDLWQWELPDSKAINYAIRYEPRTFDHWDTLSVEGLKETGEAMLCLVDATVGALSKKPRELCFGEIEGLAINSSCFASELGHVLAERSPSKIGVVWAQEDDQVRVELRSTGDGPDVGALAKELGGGGHVHAAGFKAGMEFLEAVFDV